MLKYTLNVLLIAALGMSTPTIMAMDGDHAKDRPARDVAPSGKAPSRTPKTAAPSGGDEAINKDQQSILLTDDFLKSLIPHNPKGFTEIMHQLNFAERISRTQNDFSRKLFLINNQFNELIAEIPFPKDNERGDILKFYIYTMHKSGITFGEEFYTATPKAKYIRGYAFDGLVQETNGFASHDLAAVINKSVALSIARNSEIVSLADCFAATDYLKTRSPRKQSWSDWLTIKATWAGGNIINSQFLSGIVIGAIAAGITRPIITIVNTVSTKVSSSSSARGAGGGDGEGGGAGGGARASGDAAPPKNPTTTASAPEPTASAPAAKAPMTTATSDPAQAATNPTQPAAKIAAPAPLTAGSPFQPTLTITNANTVNTNVSATANQALAPQPSTAPAPAAQVASGPAPALPASNQTQPTAPALGGSSHAPSASSMQPIATPAITSGSTPAASALAPLTPNSSTTVSAVATQPIMAAPFNNPIQPTATPAASGSLQAAPAISSMQPAAISASTPLASAVQPMSSAPAAPIVTSSIAQPTMPAPLASSTQPIAAPAHTPLALQTTVQPAMPALLIIAAPSNLPVQPVITGSPTIQSPSGTGIQAPAAAVLPAQTYNASTPQPSTGTN